LFLEVLNSLDCFNRVFDHLDVLVFFDQRNADVMALKKLLIAPPVGVEASIPTKFKLFNFSSEILVFFLKKRRLGDWTSTSWS